jgi:hypothetical protein
MRQTTSQQLTSSQVLFVVSNPDVYKSASSNTWMYVPTSAPIDT